MPRKVTPATMANDLYTAMFKRKTTQGKINKTIDAFFEDNVLVDEALHFTNEVVIHQHARQHVRNTLRYTVKPMLKKALDKLLP